MKKILMLFSMLLIIANLLSGQYYLDGGFGYGIVPTINVDGHKVMDGFDIGDESSMDFSLRFGYDISGQSYDSATGWYIGFLMQGGSISFKDIGYDDNYVRFNTFNIGFSGVWKPADAFQVNIGGGLSIAPNKSDIPYFKDISDDVGGFWSIGAG